MASAAQIRANEKYDKVHTTGVYLKLNNETDKDILEYLASVPNRQGYIKQLIRKDMEQSVPVLAEEGFNSVCPVCGKDLFTYRKRYCSNCNSELYFESDLDKDGNIIKY